MRSYDINTQLTVMFEVLRRIYEFMTEYMISRGGLPCFSEEHAAGESHIQKVNKRAEIIQRGFELLQNPVSERMLPFPNMPWLIVVCEYDQFNCCDGCCDGGLLPQMQQRSQQMFCLSSAFCIREMLSEGQCSLAGKRVDLIVPPNTQADGILSHSQ